MQFLDGVALMTVNSKRNVAPESEFMNCRDCGLRIPISLEAKHWEAYHK